MRYALALLLLLPGLVSAQAPGPQDNVFSLNLPGGQGNFRDCGLISRISPNLTEGISPSCFQNILNSYLDEDGSIIRRGGFSQYNLTPCTGSQPIKGLWSFNSTNGVQYLVAFSSMSMYYSAGDGTCSMINPSGSGYWGLSTTAEMQCVQSQGHLWCGDGIDSPFRTNVASSQTLPGAPIGPLMGAYRNRILIGAVPGTLTDVYLSGELNGLDWALPTVQYTTSPAIIPLNGVNDGLKANCFMGEFQNQFLIGRDYDLYALSGYSIADFTLRKISNQIGCIEPKSVQEVNNRLLWMSKRGVEALSGTQIESISYFIRPTIAQIIAAAGNSRSTTLTSQADWQAGNLEASGRGAQMSATISPGNVVSTTWTVTENSGAVNQWKAGTFTNTTSSGTGGVLALSVSTQSALLTSPSWVFGSGTNDFINSSNSSIYTNAASGDTFDTGYQYVSTTSLAYGVWQATMAVQFDTFSSFIFSYSQLDFVFISDTSTFSSTNGYTLFLNGNGPASNLASVSLQKLTNGARSALASGTIPVTGISAASGNEYSCHFTIFRSTAGEFLVTGCGASLSATDTSVTLSTAIIVNSLSQFTGLPSVKVVGSTITNITLPTQYYSKVGSFLSQAFDTRLSTPVWGLFDVTQSSNAIIGISYLVQVATSANGAWDTATTGTPGALVTSAQKRFVRYEADFTTANSTQTPTISSVGLAAETTGYYITTCVLVSTPTSWGQFNVDAVTNGGSFTFWVSTGATCAIATAVNANWATQSANSQIVVSTLTAYVASRVLFSMTSSTQTPTLNDITFNWNNGSNRPPVASLQYNDRYYMFYTTNTVGSPANDHALVYDFNNRWTLLDDIHAYSASLYLNQPYIGDSAATGLIYQLESGQSDNGGSFNYAFQTGDLSLGSPAERKDFERLYLYVNSPVNSAQSISLSCNYSLDGSSVTYSLSSYPLSSAPQGAAYSVAKFSFPSGQPSTGHWLNLACNYSGNTGPVRVFGLQIVWRKSSWE